MQKMLNMCNVEFKYLDMSVNTNKSVCMRVGKRYLASVDNLYIDNEIIAWTDPISYLDLTRIAGIIFKCDLHKRKTKYFRSQNCILGKIGISPGMSFTLSMINTICLPSLLYGLEAVRLTKKQVESIVYPYNAAFVKTVSKL